MAHPTVIDISSSSEDEGQTKKIDAQTTSTAKGLAELDPALHTAIYAMKPERLQKLVLELCTKLPAAAEIASSLILTPPDSGLKRGKWATCKNCRREFDITKNDNEMACEYHPGELIVVDHTITRHFQLTVLCSPRRARRRLGCRGLGMLVRSGRTH